MTKDKIPESFMQKLQNLYEQLHTIAGKDDVVSEVPRSTELYDFVMAILEFSDGFCLDNTEEREALADVLSCELDRFYRLTRRRI